MNHFFSFRLLSSLPRPAGLGLLCLMAGPVAAQLPAFPGAEGAGKYTTGGRGTTSTPTTVMEVTNLNDSGAGSLRQALTGTYASRTVVFRVCGTIHLVSQLSIPANTTLAGQTAPGDGICVADKQSNVKGNNVIVRFMRFRLGDQYQNLGMVNGSGNEDAFDAISGTTGLIVDHCTFSWGDDESFTCYKGDNTTLQWNLISEGLNYSYHFETGDTDFEHHGYGGIWGGRHASFHHNLLAHMQGRNPRFDGSRNLAPYTAGQENAELVNNVIYDWGSYTTNGGEGGNYNIINNYYKYGPNTNPGSSSGVAVRSMIINPYKQTSSPILPYGKYYLSGNYVDNSAFITSHNWYGAAMSGGTMADTVQSKVLVPFVIESYALPTQTAAAAYASVLAGVGCTLPTRDPVDTRIIQEVQDRTGKIIDVQGGFPAHVTPYSTSQVAWNILNCNTPPPVDTDHDGMPDTYETANGLNPNDPADRAFIAANGYTNLENYLNGLVAATVLSTHKASTSDLLQVYPNPAQAGQSITVTHPAQAGAAGSFTIYSFEGRLVGTVVAQPGTSQTQLDVRQLATGNYLLVYQSAPGAQRMSVKFVKTE
ncbi:T9SS type A sorting domain-containing protein [Hymenobacter sp. BRD67]|uniref:T9SS type A sorting domain-containing protein n=1 Tax=Hymenobacter sp. BRD67 TaxID=2675877 RepID=UPI0015658219|nr:T9SS type A sorting domain-containing protein [Hymenobacter sp. BRD67]QKG51897.1 T9SS type A sorting domain-containing protein [Hymenobacter sp. BRD67]